MGRVMGLVIDRSPKWHPELAGEGIEYAWGASKNYYRSLPLAEERTKASFKSAVRKSISRQIITTEAVQRYWRRDRRYICAFKTFAIKQNEQALTADQATQKAEEKSSSYVDIEKLVKTFKTHRCALNFDHKFIKEEGII